MDDKGLWHSSNSNHSFLWSRSWKTSITVLRCWEADRCTTSRAGTAMVFPLSWKLWASSVPQISNRCRSGARVGKKFRWLCKRAVCWIWFDSLCCFVCSSSVCKGGHRASEGCFPALGGDGRLGPVLLHLWWCLRGRSAESVPRDAQQGGSLRKYEHHFNIFFFVKIAMPS